MGWVRYYEAEGSKGSQHGEPFSKNFVMEKKEKYEVYRFQNYIILDRKEFPRIRIFAILKDSETVIEKITLIDKTSARIFEPALKEIENLGLLRTKESAESLVQISLIEGTSPDRTPQDWLQQYRKPA